MRRPEPLFCAALTAVALLLPLAASAADRVRCHVDYGGETRTIEAGPVASALTVAPVEVGSYFRFRLVLERTRGLPDDLRIETFADREDGPVLIHQARYAAPLHPAGRRGGFTGYQTVYEPVRDGELQYWCEWISTK
ncbi:hypothetical protein [uncultured Sphaerotilus sp.]|uniref:hypothetical protein n=1 Tax=uncultured Sphaerotilus sp. TaxID=474984 RepID=UPI0030CA2318